MNMKRMISIFIALVIPFVLLLSCGTPDEEQQPIIRLSDRTDEELHQIIVNAGLIEEGKSTPSGMDEARYKAELRFAAWRADQQIFGFGFEKYLSDRGSESEARYAEVPESTERTNAMQRDDGKAYLYWSPIGSVEDQIFIEKAVIAFRRHLGVESDTTFDDIDAKYAMSTMTDEDFLKAVSEYGSLSLDSLEYGGPYIKDASRALKVARSYALEFESSFLLSYAGNDERGHPLHITSTAPDLLSQQIMQAVWRAVCLYHGVELPE